MSIARTLAIAVTFALGCTAEEPEADLDSTSSGDGSTTTTLTATNPTTLADESSSTTGPPPGDGILQCTEVCTVPLDCCLPGEPACPGAYPFNVDCVDGVCRPPHCEGDDDCTNDGESCRAVRGTSTCITACADDGACLGLGASFTCSGTTDEGDAFCFERCDAAGVFCGNETCDPVSGLCVCTDSGDCPNNEECLD